MSTPECLREMQICHFNEWTNPLKWARKMCKSENNGDWYRHGLMNEVASLLGPRDHSGFGRNALIVRHHGKGALHANVIRKIEVTGDSLTGNPFVNPNDERDFGCTPVQSDWKWENRHLCRTFYRQKLSDLVQLNFDAYTRYTCHDITEPRDKKLSKKHDYFYIFPHASQLAVDVDCKHITQSEFFDAIRDFIQALVATNRSLRNDGDPDHFPDWIGVYISSTMGAYREEESTPDDANVRMKRSAHIHCHLFGPVARSFTDFGEFLLQAVFPRMQQQYCTLIDVSIYSNGRAFRALGQSKLVAADVEEKPLHPKPVFELSGRMVNDIWERNDERGKLFLLATAHPGVVHDDHSDPSNYIPSSPKRSHVKFNLRKRAEDYIHWKHTIDSVLKELYNQSDESFQSKHKHLLMSKHGACRQEESTPDELWKRYTDRSSGLYEMINILNDDDTVSKRNDQHYAIEDLIDSHFERFFKGDFEIEIQEVVNEFGGSSELRALQSFEDTIDSTEIRDSVYDTEIEAYHISVDTRGVIRPHSTEEAMQRKTHFMIHISISQLVGDPRVQNLVLMRRMTQSEQTAYNQSLKNPRNLYPLAEMPPWAIGARSRYKQEPYPKFSPLAPELSRLSSIGVVPSNTKNA